ncbi:FAD-dependent oxidoreductase [Roseobacter sp. N2S]|uniref:GcvT family protein n=1 Tax=Roseobacter sp. N2S TaxID=2663844 RepID=UPI00286662ED|nr:FAD-dependent oxidoreductase [Roseobacter sp. N2S]MDR6264248.1 dimethylglycine dehydrogenase [Roseobacter sp. N2S]
MKTHAQAVVIGGGLVGCSILYHLAKLGWRDVVLLERDELTSGSTWHAAANLHGLHDNNNISKIQYYTMNLYKELEQETGQGCGVFQPGSIYLAQTENREHQLRLQESKARYFGEKFYELTPEQALEKNPFLNLDGVRCIMFEEDGGNVDPSGVTQAYATGARQMGAEIHRFCPATATLQQPDGSWIVETPKGNIHTQWVVNVGGLWAREVAAMAGVKLPLQPTEHQYLVTETIPEIAAMDRRLPSVADRDGEYYMRQEGNGLLIGAYEKNLKFWAEEGTPAGFGHELFDGDLDRIMDNLERAMERVPVAATAGIKRVINGPMIWSPDSAALYGPVPELKNYFCCCGIIPGFSQSGGLGLMSAQWIIQGEPEFDMFPWDLTRFGHWADKKFTMEKVADQYSKRFAIHFPFEERQAGRETRVRPIYQRQKQMGAVHGLNYGWEHPLWYAGAGIEGRESYGYTRQDWFEPVGRECRNLRENVGVVDVSNFGKYEIKGAGAAGWIDRIIANHVPKQVGRSCLTPMLGIRGGIAGDFTVTKLAEDHFFMIGTGIGERYHQRYFQMVPLPEGTTFETVTDAYCGVNVAGPKSRELLSRLTQEDLSNTGWPFMRSRKFTIAGIEAIGIRVSFTGDLGWEIYVAEADQAKLWDALFETGKDLGIMPVGGRSLGCLRIEKGYGSWSREYSPEYWPQEVGFERLIKMDKPEFLGREAYAAIMDNPPREKLVCLSIETDNADSSGGEPIFLPDGTPVGRISSGAYGFSVGKSCALAFVKTAHATPGTVLDVAVLGRPHKGIILAEPPFDPAGLRLRG